MKLPIKTTALALSALALTLAGCGGGGTKRPPVVEPVVILSGSWQHKQILDVGTLGTQPSLAINDSGIVVLAWNRANEAGLLKCVGADTFSLSESNWSRIPRFSECAESEPVIRTVAISTANRQAAAWVSQSATGSGSVRSIELDTNTAASRLIPRDFDIAPIRLEGASGTSEGAVLWEQTSGSSFGLYENIWMLRHTDSDGWSDTVIDLNYQSGTSTYYNRNGSPTLYMNSSGVSLLTWHMTAGFYMDVQPQLQAMFYAPATGEFEPASTYARLRVYSDVNEVPLSRTGWVDEEGNATLVWVQSTPEANTRALRYRRYDKELGWSAVNTLDSVTIGNITNVQIQGDTAGNLLLVWEKIAEEHAEYYARFDIETAGWSTPAVFGPGEYRQAKLSGDADGNAVLVAVEGNTDIIARRYNASDNAWLPSELLHQSPYVNNLVMRSNMQGETVLAWNEDSDSIQRIWTMRLTSP